MEPIKGGALANLEKLSSEISVDRNEFARLALNFVRGLDVSIILSGMSSLEHVVNNRKTFSEPVAPSEEDDKKRAQILEMFTRIKIIPCTACRYCEKECPKKIPIPDIFSFINNLAHHGAHHTSFFGLNKNNYRRYMFERGKASDCIKCGACEKRCPQKIQIRKHLREAAKIFEGK